MNGAQALFKALTDAGLDTCFANPGTSEMQLVYEIGQTSVDFSVGEIIGGLLVGTGVAAAGISYATREKEKPLGDNQ